MQFRRFVTSLVFVLLVAGLAIAQSDDKQSGDKLSGKYEGVAKSEALGDLPLTVQIKHDNGKLTGSIDTAQGSLPITAGSYSDGKINLKFDFGGNEGVVTAELKEGKIKGTWSLAGQTGTLELKMAGAAGATPATPATPPATPPAASGGGAKPAVADPLSGEWDANADAAGQAVPFVLKLKLDGEKVTGESTSDQGTAAVSKGTFSSGKLMIVLDVPGGSITLNGTVSEGKINGDFDFAGQFQGKWTAKKKS
jgi:hypothetical protein